jgi:hypothetical protein
MFDRRVAEAPGVTTPTTQNLDASATNTPGNSYEVRASFYARRNGSDVPLAPGSRVRPGDELFAVVDASKPVFVYIIDRDDTGLSAAASSQTSGTELVDLQPLSDRNESAEGVWARRVSFQNPAE